MDITKIGHGENPDAVKAIIEVPLNSAIKYEIDKDSGAVEVDRVLYSAMHYPANYGFVANTLSDDGDPVDAFLYGAFLPDAVAARLFGDRDAVLPAGKRVRTWRGQPGGFLRRLAPAQSLPISDVERCTVA